MYKLFRSFLFLFDPERVHYFSMNTLKFICKIPFGRRCLKRLFQPEKTSPATFFDLKFPNRVGLAAGFDKNALYLAELETLGFGFVEIGTVTPISQAGNAKPRLFRLPKDKAIINRMGFNNDGVHVIAGRLSAWQQKNNPLLRQDDSHLPGKDRGSTMIIGGNIGKNKSTSNEDAWKDYEICFTALYDYVDYFVVNVSSPNTPGLRELQEKDSLRIIFSKLKIKNEEGGKNKPILLKISPDLSTEQLDELVDFAMEFKLDGLVVSNTTIRRENLKTGNQTIQEMGAGGLSGLPLKERSTQLINYISKKTNGKIPVIATGGIFTAADAREKLDAGASLIQVWTGFIYEGPAIVKKICRGMTGKK
jgi:dihydroorotate dehydrogenase